MKSIDPTRMSASAILAEVGEILASAFQRIRTQESKAVGGEQISQDQLDVVGDVEAPCGSAMEAPA